MFTDLVPGRFCGGCTVCCKALSVEAAELRKPPGVLCTHCTGQDCAIHETRPQICRTFFCGWYYLPFLNEDWRPDKSGVLISPQNENVPAHFDKQGGIEFLAVGGERALRQARLAELIARFIAEGIPTFLGIPGPAGFYPARCLLNDPLGEAVAKRDTKRVKDILVRIFRSREHHQFASVPSGDSEAP